MRIETVGPRDAFLISRVKLQVLVRAASALGCLLVCCLFPWFACADDDDDKGKPSGASTLVAPAGVLVLDAATGKPAVGSLPVDFVRSPAHGGPDGKGRDPVVVNSGYGVQFDARTKRGQPIARPPRPRR